LQYVVKRLRGGDEKKEIEYKGITLHVLDREIRVPTQMFINGKFVHAKSGKTDATINPTTEEEIAQVSHYILAHSPTLTHTFQIAEGDAEDVNEAVKAAKEAFDNGPWRKMNARDRGRLMYKLADVMEEHKEILAAIESTDSGAVYTLALKTHVGEYIHCKYLFLSLYARYLYVLQQRHVY